MTENKQNESGRTADRHLESHHRLEKLLDTVCGTSEFSKLGPLLDALDAELREHFKEEEAPDGFGALVTESAPRMTGEIERLFKQHAEFLDSLERLRNLSEPSLSSATVEAAKELCGCIREHEIQENKLLAEALYTDIGGCG